ncbi:MAG: hypothetical protein ACN4GG_10135 [Akkermansiaceae bacterium]
MTTSAFTFAIAAIASLTTVADAAVVVTQLPDLGVQHGDGTYEIDIDNNGVWDVAFVANSGVEFSAISNTDVRIQAIPELPPDLGSDALSLAFGSIVGPLADSQAVWHQDIIGSSTMRVCTNLFCVGNWPTGTFTAVDPSTGLTTIFPESGYLAVEFTNDTGLHYGWIDIGVIGFFPTARIYGWGWETEPDTAVMIIPEPSASGLVFLSGLLVVMRRVTRISTKERTRCCDETPTQK